MRGSKRQFLAAAVAAMAALATRVASAAPSVNVPGRAVSAEGHFVGVVVDGALQVV